ncbi:adenosine deaminase [Spongisporangium articulatum]|uniref:Adenine deaminase n=1 Tax=Spongisporangium articulatum TaxID=3362603 RepID=A0ABW8ALC3_9ACTN
MTSPTSTAPAWLSLPTPPTAELHLHIEGTIEADLLVAAAKRNGVELPSYDPAVLTERYEHFADLQAFLDVHYANLAVLRTEQDFYELASGYLTRAAAAGVRRVEAFFDPQTHVNHGVPLGEVIGGLSAAFSKAEETHGISAVLLLSFLRDLGAQAAEEIFRAAMPYREHFVGVALDSTEVGYPPSLFEKVYGMAASEGLHRVAHAGEEGGPDYVVEALDLLGVERVDHGNRALEDDDLVRRLAEDGTPLTVCPLSNVYLKGVPSMAEHPLPRMLEAGLTVTINSDDPAYFGGYVDANYAAVAAQFELSRDGLAQLAANSFEATFSTPEQRTQWLGEVEVWRVAAS